MRPSKTMGYMHHWLLRATPLPAAILGLWTTLVSATSTLHNGIEPVVGTVPLQQQQSGPPILLSTDVFLSPSFQFSSGNTIASASKSWVLVSSSTTVFHSESS